MVAKYIRKITGNSHGSIIKWTQQIGYLNIGWDGTSRRRELWERFKRRVARILDLSQFGEI